MLRRIATSVVGSSSCLRKNHFAGYIWPIALPSSKTVRWPVIICFCPSSVTVHARRDAP